MFMKSPDGKSFTGGIGSLGLLVLAGFAVIVISAGCGEVTSSPIDTPAVDAKSESGSATAPAAPSVKAGGDDLDLARVTYFSVSSTPGVTPEKVRAAAVTAKFTAASTDGDKLYTSYEPYSFPNKDGVDAVAYFFYISGGTVHGGKFDWWKAGGQPAKTLENVHHGYGGLRMPARGTECWTMISSIDGSQRSNTVKVTWR
jgi:hypothetical protein